MLTYSAIDISSFFILKGTSPLKLQKLLFYTQIWFFVKTNKYLFRDKVSAWIYGPVIYDVWNKFRFIKRTAIIPEKKVQEKINFTHDVEKHLEEIWNIYGNFTASELVELTHEEIAWKESRLGLLKNEPSQKEVFINKNTTKNLHLHNNTIPLQSFKVFKKGGRYSNIS